MIGIGLALSGQALAGGRPFIRLSGQVIDDDSAAGSLVGVISVENTPSASWSITLEDNADGMFALSGNNLVTGINPLNHGTAPSPKIILTATDGERSISQPFSINVRRPLPTLPLAAGAKVVGLGHSFIQRGGWAIVASGSPKDLAASIVRGVLPWVRLRDNRFNLDVWHDLNNNLGNDNYINGAFQGRGGDHIVAEGSAPGTIARTANVASMLPGIVYLDIGTNDISSGAGVTSPDKIIERLDRQLTLLRNEGIWTVIQTITDRGAWAEGSQKASIVAGVNEWIVAQATREGVRVCDLTGSGFNHPGFDQTLFGGDVLHPNPKGAERMSGILLPVLQSMVSAGEHMDISDSAVLSASNLWSDAAFASTSTAGGTGASGTRVSTLSIARASGNSTAICSVETAESHKTQVVTITPSGTLTGNRYEEWRVSKTAALTLSTAGIVPGVDWLESGIHVELNPWDGWLSVYWQMEFYNGSNAQAFIVRGGLQNADYTTQDLPLAADGFSGWLKIPPFLVPAGIDATTLRIATRPLVININRQVSGQGIIRISKPFLRKCADPRPAWNVV
nr:SGNH/GDSL hydrolase family protein [Rhizobium sp. ACO-34A]